MHRQAPRPGSTHAAAHIPASRGAITFTLFVSTCDIRVIAPDLVDGKDEALPKTRSEETRWSSKVRQRLPEWLAAASVRRTLSTSATWQT